MDHREIAHVSQDLTLDIYACTQYGFPSLYTANVTCAKVRTAPPMLYATFNPPLGIQNAVILRIMPPFLLSLSLQQQCHFG